MPKLYFRYGTMGSSKTANALMTRFNYIEKGMKVLLLKPSVDDRYEEDIVQSRIGLSAEAELFRNIDDLTSYGHRWCDVVVVDEAQFCTKGQVEQLKLIAETHSPVFAYGLRTNFKSELFEGSKRLFELADSITEIKSICHCGNKAIINARIVNDHIVYDG
ncbi:Thymidine kinase [compost metagenome]